MAGRRITRSAGIALCAAVLVSSAGASADARGRGALLLPRVAVQVIPVACPVWLSIDREPACTYPGGPIYLAPDTPYRRRTRIHEEGHHVDYGMADGYRQAFTYLRGFPPGYQWRTPPNSPHEQFAEAWSLCSIPPRRRRGRINGGYGYNPIRSEYARICALFRTIPVEEAE